MTSDEQANNKGNGYRQIQKAGMGSQLQLKIPRDRLGVFQPVIMGVIQQQDQQLKQLSYSLYGKGLSTRQISEVLEDIYRTAYSKFSISAITQTYQELVKAWQHRALDAYYPVIFIDAIHIKVRRDTVATEAFYVVLGLKEELVEKC